MANTKIVSKGSYGRGEANRRHPSRFHPRRDLPAATFFCPHYYRTVFGKYSVWTRQERGRWENVE